ncbi:acyltransferase domain-containing protein [Streptomyces lavendulae]|uniref:acyltransferase domain-containing protein n=1 Tax=Streptomyces lavendulae TaxID=1914 RepID=UPI0033F410C8
MTIAGEAAALRELGARLDEEGVFFRDLDLDYAFHTPAMDPVKESLAQALAGLRPGKCQIPMVSTVTGAAVDGPELGSAYWWRNVRDPVLFARAVGALTGSEVDCDVLVEIGPHPVLGTYLRRAGAGLSQPVAVIPTLSRVLAGPDALDDAHARLLAVGAQVDWSVSFPPPGKAVDLPAYPWQRGQHWNGRPDWWLEDAAPEAAAQERHPLLGARQPVATPVWRGRIDPDALGWLADHTISGTVVWPAAGYVDMALSAGQDVYEAPVEITGLTIDRALTLPFDDPGMDVELSTSLAADGEFVVSSRTGELGEWNDHARGRARRLLRDRSPSLDVDAIRIRLPEAVSREEHYTACAGAGLSYGPAFRILSVLHTGRGEVLAQYEGVLDTAPGHQAHPCLVDGALQAGMPLLAGVTDGSCPFLPAGIETVRCWRPVARSGLVHVKSRRVTAEKAVWDITVSDAHGAVSLELLGCRLRRFATGSRPSPQRLTEVLRAVPLPGGPPGPRRCRHPRRSSPLARRT